MNKLRKQMIIGCCLLIGTVGIFIRLVTFLDNHPRLFEEISEASLTAVEETNSAKLAEIATRVHLDVPQLNQMDAPRLYNGCEVTSLAMLLNFFGNNVTKNELAENLPVIDYLDSSGYYGNPNEGFIGDMSGNNEPGYFIYHEPIFNLAQKYDTENLTAIDLTGTEFERIQATLTAGSPVWMITTTSFSATSDLEVWQTKNGNVQISMSEHSVVLVGYDENYAYLNDPYVNQNYATDLTSFIESWEQMGSQAITMLEA